MKKIALIFTILISITEAKEVKLTPQQSRNWHIETKKPVVSDSLVVGKFMAEVVTPPQLLQTVSLPFEAQIKKIYVANFDNVKRREPLAEVTGRDWIELQKRFISDAIELKHHKSVADRKDRLCQEEIIPRKECISANAEYRADRIKVSASKALLRGYGADEKMIRELFENLKISQTLKVHSDVDGKVVELNARSGKSLSPSEALFVIQKDGALWLEVNILAKKASTLRDGERVKIEFNSKNFISKLLLHAPVIDSKNQTQKVRFSLPKGEKFITGMRDIAKISTLEKSLKVPKRAVVSYDGESILFIKTDGGYSPTVVEILGEDRDSFYLRDTPNLHKEIAITSTAILKGLMEEGDE